MRNEEYEALDRIELGERTSPREFVTYQSTAKPEGRHDNKACGVALVETPVIKWVDLEETYRECNAIRTEVHDYMSCPSTPRHLHERDQPAICATA